MHDDSRVYWIALTKIPKFGPVTIRKKWQQSQSVEEIWHSIVELVDGGEEILSGARSELDLLEARNAKVLTLDSPEYPIALRDLEDMPPVLYAAGDVSVLQAPCVGIVGTRSPSSYGKNATATMSVQLSQQSFAIVSGMARGIDAVAHKAVLDHGGRTIAVWGSGLDKPYPAENAQLAERIAQCGVVLSQYPLGTEAQSFTFPARNKIIAGLSKAILITEAKIGSGSLLTAEYAKRYGKTVFALPGSVYSQNSQGPHELIRGGASLAVDATDIVNGLGGHSKPHKPELDCSSLSPQEGEIVRLLQGSPLHIDELIRVCKSNASAVSSCLITLEMKGVVDQFEGGEYYLK